MAERPDKERLMGTEEATAHGILGMLGSEEERNKILSDLDEEEIASLSLLDTIGHKLKLTVIDKFIDNFLQFRVSRFRMGRRELSNVLTFAGFGGMEDRRKARSIKDLFGGLR